MAVGICWHCFGRKQLEIPYVICGVSSRFGCRETHLQGPKNGKMWETKVTRGKSFSDLFGNSVVFVTRRTSWFQVDFKNQLHIFRSWSRPGRGRQKPHIVQNWKLGWCLLTCGLSGTRKDDLTLFKSLFNKTQQNNCSIVLVDSAFVPVLQSVPSLESLTFGEIRSSPTERFAEWSSKIFLVQHAQDGSLSSRQRASQKVQRGNVDQHDQHDQRTRSRFW